jgi:predicted nucleotide-binding protein (sugar kinase/HSP70/actin superfamily)
MVEERKSLLNRTMYVPRMTYGGARSFCAAFRSIGVDTRLSPDSDGETLELGGRYISGDECYPEKITLGNFLKVINAPDFDPGSTAFFMPTAFGPCRFGQYGPYLKYILDDLGHHDAIVVSPTSDNGYEGLGDSAQELIRTLWRGIVSADVLRKMMLRTRPYEKTKGDTDAVYEESLNITEKVLESTKLGSKERMERLVDSLAVCRDKFRAIPAEYDPERPLIGIVGEIFCRLNRFSNDETIRRIEELGGECWLSDMAEWVWYTNQRQKEILLEHGKKYTPTMAAALLRNKFQRSDEHRIYGPFHDDFRGYEEPEVTEVLKLSEPYVPPSGAVGEMVLSIGKAIYLHNKGADGIVDISPFTCMNGIVCEAVYPDISHDHDRFPIRNFYFDGTQSDLDRDLDIFLELARTYKRRKKPVRTYPDCFPQDG